MLDSFGVAGVRALCLYTAEPDTLCAAAAHARRRAAKTFPASFVSWFVAVNDRQPRRMSRHLKPNDGSVRSWLGCPSELHGNAAVWGGGVGAVVAGAAAHPSGSVAAAFDGALAGDALAWLRRRRVLRQQLALHAMLVGVATRLRLRRSPEFVLGLEAARFHDQRAPERRRSLYGRRGVADDVVSPPRVQTLRLQFVVTKFILTAHATLFGVSRAWMRVAGCHQVVLSAYDIGLLRVHQQTRLLKTLEKDPSLSDTSAPVKRAKIGLNVAHEGMQALHTASTSARGHRAKFVYYYLFDPSKPTMVRYIIFVITLTLLAYFSSTGNLLEVTSASGGTGNDGAGRRGGGGGSGAVSERAKAFWVQAAVGNLATGDALPGSDENHEVEYFGNIEGAEGFWDFMTGK